MRLSSTDREGNRRRFCQVRDRPRAARLCVLSRSMRSPWSVIVPASAGKMPLTRLKSDVLPAPFGPMSPTTRPADSVRSIASATTIPPKRLSSPRTSSMADIGGLLRRTPEIPGGDETLRPPEHEYQNEPGEEQPLKGAEKRRRQVQEGDRLRQRLEEHRSDDGTPGGPDAAHHDHREDGRGLEQLELLRRNESEIVGVERTREAGEPRAEGEDRDLHGHRIAPQCAKSELVVSHGAECPPIRAVRDAAREQDGKPRDRDHEGDIGLTPSSLDEEGRYVRQAARAARERHVLDRLKQAELEADARDQEVIARDP